VDLRHLHCRRVCSSAMRFLVISFTWGSDITRLSILWLHEQSYHKRALSEAVIRSTNCVREGEYQRVEEGVYGGLGKIGCSFPLPGEKLSDA